MKRAEAKALGLKKYNTGKACLRGHICNRFVAGANCVICFKEWRKNNVESASATQRKYRAANPEKTRIVSREGSRKWRADPVHLEKHNEENRVYKKFHPEIVCRQSAKRRAQKLNQTPVLTEDEQRRIDGNYELAQTLTKIMGIQYDVDHIIPLSKGGLHHPDNLRVITHEENMRKCDKLVGEY